MSLKFGQYLQGLILEDIDKIPKILRFKSSFLKIDNFLKKTIFLKICGSSYLNKEYDRLVVGVASVKELNEIVSFIKLKKN